MVELNREIAVLLSDGDRSEAEMCAILADELGIDAPVPLAVMRRALVDKLFAFRLMNCQGDPVLLGVVFADPANQRFADDTEPAGTPAVPSSFRLALRAGKAIARWGASGFGRVEPEVFEARFAACQRCEFLVEPPERVVYKVALRRDSDPRVCSACGCVASRKASLPTENCPVADERDPSLSRWGEPRTPTSS
jgi:hypothetical protein